MKKLGFQPVPGSGSGWVAKEDGENEVAMVQLKSTDSESYRINLLDIKKLEYHATVSNKVPIFLIQFLQPDRIYALVPVENIIDIYKAFELKEPISQSVILNEAPAEAVPISKKIKSTKEAREQFFEERGREYGKRKGSKRSNN